jgi:hypothetical protein
MAQNPGVQSDIAASSDDVRRILGELDEAKLLDILALRPTVLDVENASMELSGDRDIFGAGEPLKGVSGDIVGILMADEEEEPAPAP